MKELLYILEIPTQIFFNNILTIKLTKNLAVHGRSKHIGTRCYFIIHQVKKNNVKLTYCKTEDKIVNIFTKSLKPKIFSKLKEIVGMMNKFKGSVRIQT